MTQTNKILCPDCSSEIKLIEGVMIGDILECEECGTEVEILSIDPLEYRELIEEKWFQTVNTLIIKCWVSKINLAVFDPPAPKWAVDIVDNFAIFLNNKENVMAIFLAD